MSGQMQAGEYLGNIESIAFTTASTGNPQFVMRFNVTQYGADGQWIAIEPTKRTVYATLTDKSAKQVKARFAQLGITGEPDIITDQATGEDVVTLPQGAGDADIRLRCKFESYNGEMKERWDFADVGGVAAAPAGQEAKLKLKALWR